MTAIGASNCCCGNQPGPCIVHSVLPADNKPWREWFLESGTMPDFAVGGDIVFDSPGKIRTYIEPFWTDVKYDPRDIPIAGHSANHPIWLDCMWLDVEVSLRDDESRVEISLCNSMHHKNRRCFYGYFPPTAKYPITYYEEQHELIAYPRMYAGFFGTDEIRSHTTRAIIGLDKYGTSDYRMRFHGPGGLAIVAVSDWIPGSSITSLTPIYLNSDFPFKAIQQSHLKNSYERRTVPGTYLPKHLLENGVEKVVTAGNFAFGHQNGYFSHLWLYDIMGNYHTTLKAGDGVFTPDYLFDTAVAVIDTTDILYAGATLTGWDSRSRTTDRLRRLTNGSPIAATLKDIHFLEKITAVNDNAAIMVGKDPAGLGDGSLQLLVSDGTAIGTVKATTLTKDAGANIAFGEIKTVNGRAFIAKMGGVLGSELYVSDGTAIGTVSHNVFGPGVSGIRLITPAHDTDPIAVYCATETSSTEKVYRTNLDTGATSVFYDVQAASPGSLVMELAYVDDNVYMAKYHPANGVELFVIPAVGGSAAKLDDFNPGGLENVGQLLASGLRMYFVAETADGLRVFSTMGAVNNTQQVMDMTGGENPSMVGSANDRAMFLMTPPWEPYGYPVLYSSEGSPENTWVHLWRPLGEYIDSVDIAVGYLSNPGLYISIFADRVRSTYNAIDPRLNVELHVPIAPVTLSNMRVRPTSQYVLTIPDCPVTLGSGFFAGFLDRSGPTTITMKAMSTSAVYVDHVLTRAHSALGFRYDNPPGYTVSFRVSTDSMTAFADVLFGSDGFAQLIPATRPASQYDPLLGLPIVQHASSPPIEEVFNGLVFPGDARYGHAMNAAIFFDHFMLNHSGVIWTNPLNAPLEIVPDLTSFVPLIG